tara:strand:- start:9790 stop:10146 length:357 start_codon:yes stop_codon:yes gene_type:complete
LDNLENILNITNYREHPTRPGYTVFHFFDDKQANDFKKLLEENTIWFESDVDKKDGKTIYLFGVRNSDLKKAVNLNYLVIGKYRKPFIPNLYFKWFVVVLGVLLVVAAVIGYLKSGAS